MHECDAVEVARRPALVDLLAAMWWCGCGIGRDRAGVPETKPGIEEHRALAQEYEQRKCDEKILE